MDTEKVKAIAGTAEDIIKVDVPADAGATAAVQAAVPADHSVAVVNTVGAGEDILPSGKNVRCWKTT